MDIQNYSVFAVFKAPGCIELQVERADLRFKVMFISLNQRIKD